MPSAWLACALLLSGNPQPITIDSALLTVAEQAEIAARDAGLLVTIVAREGEVVKEGDSLAQLDDAEARLLVVKATLDLNRARRLAANDIQVRQAEVECEFAKGELARAHDAEKKLKNSVSNAEFDRLRANERRAALDLEQARFDLEAAQGAVQLFENELHIAQEKLQRRRVVAPIAGSIVAVSKRRGEWVEPGEPIARILSTRTLRVEFFLQAPQATAALVGRTVRFQLASETENLTASGRIAVVSPEVDPLTGQVRVWAEIDNADGRLRPGLTGSLVIQP